MKENNPHILGTEKVGKLLLEYSIPAIIGMTLTSLYNIIDSVFIGHGVGAMAISGLAISFPLMNLLVAFCTLVGVGGATISSIRLGQKDTDGAEKVLGNVTVLCVINSIFYGGITLLFLDRILFFFGASHDTLPYARDFMQIILIGSPVTYVMIGLNNIMRATGYPRKAMLSSMLTVGCNIILAPVFIFWLRLGNPRSSHGNHPFTVCRHDMGAEPFHAGKKLYPLQERDIQIKETDRREYLQYRYVAVPDECLRFGHCHYIQQEPAALRGRSGYRRIRHIKPSADAVCNGYHGADYGNATDCGL